MSLIDHFPGTPRGEQENIIELIEDAFENEDKKFVICQAPTGSGKSHLGATLCNSTNPCPPELRRVSVTPKNQYNVDFGVYSKFGGYVLTTTKQLQDQYKELFPNCNTLKGKVNYPCAIDPICNAGCAKCAYTPSTMRACAGVGDCEYINAYSDAVKGKFSALSYNMFLSLPKALRNKQVLVCDEASELEDTLVSHFSINISYSSLDYIKVTYTKVIDENPEEGFLWLSALYDNLQSEMPSPAQLAKPKVSKYIADKARIIKDMRDSLNAIITFWNESEFLIEKTKTGITVSPLKINKLAKIMFRGVDKVLFLSATIINHVKIAEALGIERGEYKFIDAKSDFDPKKSPVYTAPAKFDMTYKHINTSMSKMIDAVLELSDIHSEDNGLIHTHNGKITKALQDAVKGDRRFIFRDKFATNEDILFEHYQNPNPTVLVSPSLAFGTSLDNEHGRFQIITKLPYLPMSDKRIKILSKRDFDWYQMKMWITMIQMCGRCTRSKEDHSSTYIFDKSFLTAIARYDDKLPLWFKNRLV